MKNLLIAALTIAPFLVLGQSATSPSTYGLENLSHLLGQWEGSGWAMSPDGSRNEFDQHEAIESKLGGRIMVVEGIGKKTGTEEIAFNAYAIFEYDSANRTYDIRSYLASGESTNATGKFDGDAFTWQFDVPGGTVRYTMNANESTWNEYGEFSRDGQQWFKFMEMNLAKTSN